MATVENPDFDYIVIGSGAGGGPVACNLAKKGFKVGLIEAGGSPEPPEYQVPVLHPFASEHPDMAWDFFVRHYGDDAAVEARRQVPGRRGRRPLPARRHPGRLHRPPRDDHHLRSQQRLAAHRRPHRRPVVASGNHARLLRAAGAVRLRRRAEARPAQSEPPRLQGLAADDRLRPDPGAGRQGAAEDGARRGQRRLEGGGGRHRAAQLVPRDPNDWRQPQFEGVCFPPLSTSERPQVGDPRADPADPGRPCRATWSSG